jgi:Haem-binding domain
VVSRKVALRAILAVVGVLGAAQLLPVTRTNPPPSSPLAAPPAVEAVLRRACYDCHSNHTRWPWYSRLAPVSWLIARDVTLGRKEVNFSEWGSYYPATRRRKLKWIGRALHEHKMPPCTYRLFHPGARLDQADRALLERWVESAVAPSSSIGSRN